MKNETIYDVVDHAREVVYDEIRRALERTPGHKTDIDVRLVERLGLSARAWSRMLKIAMTIADLEGAESVRTEHIAEAASFRFLDRRNI